MKHRRIFAVTTVILSLLLCVDTCFAGSDSVKRKLNETNDRIKELAQSIKEGKSEEKRYASDILDEEEKIQDLEDSIRDLDLAISDGEDELDRLEKDLEEAQEKTDTQNENLGNRLRNMYKNGTVGFVDVLLSSSDFSEFLTNIDMVEKVYASDKEVLSGLEEAYDEIEEKKAEVESLQADLEESRQLKSREKSKAADKKAELQDEKQKISAKNDKNEDLHEKLKDDADRLTEELKQKASHGSGEKPAPSKKPSSGNHADSGKRLQWPVPAVGAGNITSPFGWRTHPITGVSRLHTGMDIGAPYNYDIVAAESGRVIIAGWNGGYGNCVVIDHGNGLSTLYGHGNRVTVSVGQHVSRGQTIAKVGSTGWSTGPHCHFEVRINGNYVNPYSYVL